MCKIKDIMRQKFSRKQSYRKIAQNLNLSVATVSNYVDRARKAGITSWQEVEKLSSQELRLKLFGEQKTEPIKKHQQIDFDRVARELHRKGVTLRLLWQEYKERTPDGIGYTQFSIHYKGHTTVEDKLVMIQTRKAGEKFYVDYAGTKMSIVDPVTGEIKKVNIFVGSVGFSSYIFAEGTFTQNSFDWTSSNRHMAEDCSGMALELVPDNLKAGVKKADRYDPDLNPVFREFGQHYSVAIMPARVVHPQDKAAAEAAVYLVTTQVIAPLRDKVFYDLGSLNKAIKERVAIINNAPFQKKKTTRKALFEEFDKPALQPLPATPFEFADWKKAKVNVDYHIAYDEHYYSVSYIYCGKHVLLRATSKTIEIFLDNERIAAHARSYQKYHHTTVEAHMPKAHQEQAKANRWTPETLVEGAKKIGTNTAKLLTAIIDGKDFKQQGIRACQAILRLATKFGDTRLEQANTKALAIGIMHPREIRYMLQNNLENEPIETIAKPPPIHANIRGAEYYQQIPTTVKEDK